MNTPPNRLFEHVFGDLSGVLVTFTGRQARLRDPEAPANQLEGIRQSYFKFPDEAAAASTYLLAEASEASNRDAYYGVHLFREAGSRLASNAIPTVRCLWLDEDEGHYPPAPLGAGPEPTAIVSSSANRRHLYWRLTQPVTVEWAVAMNKRIAAWADGDSGKAGLASVLRVPGTRNFKRHPQIDEVTAVYTGVGQWEPEVLEQAIPELPTPPAPPAVGSRGDYDGPEVSLTPYLENPELEVLGELKDGLGIKYAVVCPWVAEHSGGDRSGTRIGQREGGGLWFHCDHETCRRAGRNNWSAFKSKIRPVYRRSLIRKSSTTTKKARINRG